MRLSATARGIDPTRAVLTKAPSLAVPWISTTPSHGFDSFGAEKTSKPVELAGSIVMAGAVTPSGKFFAET